MVNSGPTVRQRQLASELRRLRELKGLTGEQAARKVGWQPSKISRIEHCASNVKAADLITLLDAYEAPRNIRQILITMQRSARERGWWSAHRDIFPASFPEFEDAAAVIRTYETILVPGLLQTPEYATAIFQGIHVLNQETVERRVSTRLKRQKILDRDTPPEIWAVIDEAALTKLVGGPHVMRDQLLKLIDMADRPHITIQVIPDAVGAHAAMEGGFVILDFPDRNVPLVHLEEATTSLFMEKPEEYQRYMLIFSHVARLALSPEQSMRCMTALADQLEL